MTYTIIFPDGREFGNVSAPDKKSALVIAGIDGARAVSPDSKAAQKARTKRLQSDFAKQQEASRL
jgi:hypothetical protein